jgi:hypothetical protein
MGPTPDSLNRKPNAGERLDRELAAGCSNLWGAAAATGGGGVYALYLRLKPGGVWVAVAKRQRTQDDHPMVAFGSGRSIGTALAALSTSIMQAKWKRDMPFNGDR